MELKLHYVDVKSIELSDRTCVEDGRLRVGEEEIRELLLSDKNIARAEIYVANPGDSCRILPVKDAVEPRCKPGVKQGYFGSQGVMPESIGTGDTLVLKGAAVLLLGPLDTNMEGIVDMSGKGADYTPFSKTCNLALWIEVNEELTEEQAKKCRHDALGRVAAYLAQRAAGQEDRTVSLSWEPVRGDLPRVGILDLFVLRTSYDTLVYGEDSGKFIPTVINPLAAVDGAVENVSGRISGHRPATFYHQNNPVILEALSRHGKTINLVGVLVSLHENVFEKKVKNSMMVTELARILGLDGLVVIEENKGNPDADLMLICHRAEKAGIRTVLMTDESAGEDGASAGMADTVAEADAIVTAGNCNAAVELPPMERVIGDIGCVGLINGTHHDSLRHDGSIRLELLAIPGSCNEMGYTDMTTMAI